MARARQLAPAVCLILAGNQLTGPIPAELGGLGVLQHLQLGNNQLSGPIPAELGNLASLQILSLEDNRFTGPCLPREPVGVGPLRCAPQRSLGVLTNLTALLLHDNQVDGGLPPELSDLPALTELVLAGNLLTGPLPPEWGAIATLEGLWLDRNQRSGPIPPELGRLTSLHTVSPFANRLDGALPRELGDLAALKILDLPANQPQGAVPEALGRLGNLRELRLSGNALSGAVPAELGNLANLGRGRVRLKNSRRLMASGLAITNTHHPGPPPRGEKGKSWGGSSRYPERAFVDNRGMSYNSTPQGFARRTCSCRGAQGGVRATTACACWQADQGSSFDFTYVLGLPSLGDSTAIGAAGSLADPVPPDPREPKNSPATCRPRIAW